MKNQPAMVDITAWTYCLIKGGGLSQRTQSADPRTAGNPLTRAKCGHSPSQGPQGRSERSACAATATLSPLSSGLGSFPPRSLDARPGPRAGGGLAARGAPCGSGQGQALGAGVRVGGAARAPGASSLPACLGSCLCFTPDSAPWVFLRNCISV